MTASLLEAVREIKGIMTFMMRRVSKLKLTIEDVLDDDQHMLVGQCNKSAEHTKLDKLLQGNGVLLLLAKHPASLGP